MNPIRMLLPLMLAVFAFSSARSAGANVVVAMQTVFGPIQLELFDAAAPLTVANFLGYVDAAAYDQSFIHRSVPGFVIQGGGFKIVNDELLLVAESPPTVPNEPGLSNLRGTVAMAKLGGLPDSATTQWFINTGDNPELDVDNGGYTVFADVISGMRVVDPINALIRVNVGPPFDEMPVVDWSPGDPVTFANVVLLPDVARVTSPLCGDLNGVGQVAAPEVARIRSALANPTGSALSPAEAGLLGRRHADRLQPARQHDRPPAPRGFRLPQRAQICPPRSERARPASRAPSEDRGSPSATSSRAAPAARLRAWASGPR
jgi:cyclophilin family peptidyl-prolyl cis-trans isomerase